MKEKRWPQPGVYKPTPPGVYNVADATNPANYVVRGAIESPDLWWSTSAAPRAANLAAKRLMANACPQCVEDRRRSNALGRFIESNPCVLCGATTL